MRPTLASLTAASFRAAHPRPSLLALQQLSQRKTLHLAQQQQVRFRAASALDAPSLKPETPHMAEKKPSLTKKAGPRKSYAKVGVPLVSGEAMHQLPVDDKGQNSEPGKQRKEVAEDGPAPRNSVGVQLLSRSLRRQIFPPTSAPTPPLHPDALSLCRSHLTAHNLEPSQASVLPETSFEMPPLQGKDLGEHFWNLGREVAQPWLGMAHQLADVQLPAMPEGMCSPGHKDEDIQGGLPAAEWLTLDDTLRPNVHVRPPSWVRQPGWTRYPLLHSADGKDSALGPGEAVEFPLPEDGSLSFDVETMVAESHFAVMATAAGPGAWYSWLSPWLLGEGEGHERKDHLIPFGPAKTVEGSLEQPARLIIGHNVGYDRARIRDEYSLTRNNIRYLDTMSLHVATRGISSPQRPAWIKYSKNKEAKRLRKLQERDQHLAQQRETLTELLGEEVDESELQSLIDFGDEEIISGEAESGSSAAKVWLDVTAKNSLLDVAELHCGIRMSKSLRNFFIDGTPREEILVNLESLLTYCAKDVDITHQVFRKVWPTFVAHCPHPVTAAGVLGLGSAILPVDDEWIEYQKRSEAKYFEAHTEVSRCLVELAERLRKEDTAGVSWNAALEAVTAHKEAIATVEDLERLLPQEREAHNVWSRSRTQLSWEENPWTAQLDWTPKKPKKIKGAASEAEAVAQAVAATEPSTRTVPQWYKHAKRFGLGPRSAAIQPLLQLGIDGGVITKNDDGAWVLKRDGHEEEELPAAPATKATLGRPRWRQVISAAGSAGQAAFDLLRSGKPDEAKLRQLLLEEADDLVQAWAESGAVDDAAPVQGSHPALELLDWTPCEIPLDGQKKKRKPAAKAAPKSPTSIPGPGEWWPKWYWDLFDSSTGELKLTIRTRISPLLLRISWQGCPLHHSREHGWILRHDQEVHPNFHTRQTPIAFENKADNALKRDLLVHPNVRYYKVPHAAGNDANVGSPLSKGFVPFFESDTLRSEHPDEASKDVARAALMMNAQCSYWIGVRDRVANQMVIWDREGGTSMGFDAGASGARQDDERERTRRKGLILPPVIAMGTVTRRAIEKTWLTASNAKKNRVGSELKSMVKAPPGWSIVGADVDSEELWICSVMGDAQFGIHGATAVGWMTLEGTKAQGTDLHSKTAGILGTSRNQAKIFNYSRIYGAGIKHATQLLLKADPSMASAEATKLAKALYSKTKGSNTHKDDSFGRKFWFGGTESYVFNKLEEVATSEKPMTPALDCGVTFALSSKYLPKTKFASGTTGEDYMPSRINWVVQSSGVDYLHLLIASMEHICKHYDIRARFMLSVHDEVRYLARDEDAHRAALALQIANLWTRSMFAYKLEMDDLPQGVAFFAQVDLDKVLRKEADDPCVTPSQPIAVPPGSALDIEQILKLTSGGSLHLDGRPMERGVPILTSTGSSGIDDSKLALTDPRYPPYVPADQKHRCRGERGVLFLQAQAADDLAEIRALERRAKAADKAQWEHDAGEQAVNKGGIASKGQTLLASGRATKSSKPRTAAQSASFSTSALLQKQLPSMHLPDSLHSLVAAFPAKRISSRIPFFKTRFHHAQVKTLYRALLRSLPADLPALRRLVRGLTRAKQHCVSPAQVDQLMQRGRDLLGLCQRSASGDVTARLELEAEAHRQWTKQHERSWTETYDRYWRRVNAPPIPHHSGALLPPSIGNPPVPRYKPVQPVKLSMMIFKRRAARFRRLRRKMDLKEQLCAIREEAEIMRQLGVGEDFADLEAWEQPIMDILAAQQASYEREANRSRMVFPDSILIQAKRTRKAKHRQHVRRALWRRREREDQPVDTDWHELVRQEEEAKTKKV